MTIFMWRTMIQALGLSGSTKVVEIPGHAIVAAMIIKRARDQRKVKKGVSR